MITQGGDLTRDALIGRAGRKTAFARRRLGTMISVAGKKPAPKSKACARPSWSVAEANPTRSKLGAKWIGAGYLLTFLTGPVGTRPKSGGLASCFRSGLAT
jgi:hypothetical protein